MLSINHFFNEILQEIISDTAEGEKNLAKGIWVRCKSNSAAQPFSMVADAVLIKESDSREAFFKGYLNS